MNGLEWTHLFHLLGCTASALLTLVLLSIVINTRVVRPVMDALDATAEEGRKGDWD